MDYISIYVKYVCRCCANVSHMANRGLKQLLFVSLVYGRSFYMDWPKYKNILLFCLANITHWGLYLGNLVALAYVVAYQPWYIALPLFTILGNPVVGGIQCAYNNLENVYRAKLGWKIIESNFLPAAIEDIKNLVGRYKKWRGLS